MERGQLGRIVCQGCHKVDVAFGSGIDERLIRPAFADDDVGHGQKDIDIRARRRLQPERGVLHHGRAPGVDDDERRSPVDRAHHFVGDDRMGFGRVGTGDQNTVGVADFIDGVGHGAAAEGHPKAGNGAGVAETGAVIHVVGADSGAHEFLEEIVLFIGAAGRGESGHGIASPVTDDSRQLLGHDLDGRLPVHRDEILLALARFEGTRGRKLPRLVGQTQRMGQVPAHEGGREAIRTVDEVPTRAAFDAEKLTVHRRVGIALGIDNALVLEEKLHAAAHAAVAAESTLARELPIPPFTQARLGHERGCWADLNAAAAENAGRIDHDAVKGGGDMAVKAPPGIFDRVHADDFVADAHALAAENTVLMVAHEERIVILVESPGHLEVEARRADAEFVGIFLQIAGAVFVARNAG